MLTDIDSINNVTHNQTTRYNLVNTNTVLEQLVDNGWAIEKASERFTRKAELIGKQFHIIKLVNEKYFIGDDPINLVFSNSHDGKQAAKFRLGLFRMICGNGLIVGDSLVPVMSIPHNQKRVNEAITIAMQYMVAKAQQLGDSVKLMQQKVLTRKQQEFLAHKALLIKGFKEVNNYQITSILDVNRSEDIGDDLWRTYNTVQESVEKGLYMIDEHGRGRGITSPVKKLDFNKKLFDVAYNLAA